MDDNSLQFAQPLWMLVGLLVCIGMIALFVRFDRRRDADLAKLIHPRFRQRLTAGYSPRLRNLKRALWLLAVFAGFVAVARPQKGYEWQEVKRKGIDILFAVDTSRSMLAQDLSPNRLERARLGILDFIAKLNGDRVGLIPFAGSAFALCPLTLDYDAFRESLNALDTDLIPRQGTDLASAIKEAERLFNENGNNHRVLVLLTDGEDLQGAVVDAAREAAKNGMAIYTVGVGSPEGVRIPFHDQFGRTGFVRDENGNVVETSLDESTLKQIAEITNALYVPLGRGAEGLNTIYQEKLRLVPKSELNQRMERIPLERFEWPLGAAILLILLEFFINDRLRPRKERFLPSAGRMAKVNVALALGFTMVGVSSSRGSESDPRLIYNQGTEAYHQGDYAKATESLRTSLRTPDLKLQQRSYYNLGNSLYRTGQGTLEKDPDATIKSWEESIKAYEDALSLDEGDEDARYNMELVKKKLDELKQQQNQQNQENQQDGEGDNEEQKDESKEQEKNKDQKDQNGDDSKDSKDQKEGDDGKGSKPDDSSGGEQEDGKSQEERDGNEGQEGQEGQEPNKDQAGKPEDGNQAGEEEQDAANPGEQEEGETAAQRGVKEEMTPEEAKQLLEALRNDERMVIPIEPVRPSRQLTPDNSTKGKTW